MKSPEELLEERYGGVGTGDDDDDGDDAAILEETDDEKMQKFDLKKSEIALKQATRSAEDCVGVVDEEFPKGKALVTITFANTGNVAKAEIADPYTDTKIGKCVLNAMSNVVVPPFTDPPNPFAVDWEVDLSGGEGEAEGEESE